MRGKAFTTETQRHREKTERKEWGAEKKEWQNR
jgi:hypothetical protein